MWRKPALLLHPSHMAEASHPSHMAEASHVTCPCFILVIWLKLKVPFSCSNHMAPVIWLNSALWLTLASSLSYGWGQPCDLPMHHPSHMASHVNCPCFIPAMWPKPAMWPALASSQPDGWSQPSDQPLLHPSHVAEVSHVTCPCLIPGILLNPKHMASQPCDLPLFYPSHMDEFSHVPCPCFIQVIWQKPAMWLALTSSFSYDWNIENLCLKIRHFKQVQQSTPAGISTAVKSYGWSQSSQSHGWSQPCDLLLPHRSCGSSHMAEFSLVTYPCFFPVIWQKPAMWLAHATSQSYGQPQILVHPKNKLQKPEAKGVYLIPCAGNKSESCKGFYIGETGRTLQKRMNEERTDVKVQEEKSRIADHVWSNNHHMAWDKAHVFVQEPHQRKRWFKKSLCILSSYDCFAKVIHPISHHWVKGLKNEVSLGHVWYWDFDFQVWWTRIACSRPSL